MHKRTTTQWMAASIGVALAIVFAIRLGMAPGSGRVALALRATARWSFLLFWLATTGAALAALFGPRFQALARRGRDFGLAFATAHLVHLGLVAWFYYIALISPSRSTFIFFGIAAIWIYVLAILSIKRVVARLNPKVWRVVRTLGVEYIALAFLVDFAKNPFQSSVADLIAYLPFLALAIAGPILRLAAAAKRSHQIRRLAVG
jgi:D-alanyl-lipoteichoic acid acyltransferase DltB (MBOAT superfamily)